jgi:hypothetical protein
MRIAAEEEILLCLGTVHCAFRASVHVFLVLVTDESLLNCSVHCKRCESRRDRNNLAVLIKESVYIYTRTKLN